MSREANIFHNLIRNENTLTELFCNLLQFDSLREILISLLKTKIKSQNLNFEYEDVEIEVNLNGNGICDIEIENDKLKLRKH